MSVFDHGEGPSSGGLGRVLAIGAGVVVLLAAGYAVLTMLVPARPAQDDTPPARSEPVARPAVKPAEPPEQIEAPKPPGPKPRPARRAEPVPPPPPAPTGPVLVVESDVAGASVFVDRKYLGTTPLRSADVAPGSHQLNASAAGEDGLAQAIDIAETGETVVSLSFREVRLNASLAAVHKHGLGSCSGTLTATPAGITYQTTNKKDSFTFPLSDLEVFTIDYLKKELKVKKKGGRTWNFTDRSENADKLFVFHRDVAKAREKLAAQSK